MRETSGRISAKRLSAAQAEGYDGSAPNFVVWSQRRKRCGAPSIIGVTARRCGRRVSIW